MLLRSINNALAHIEWMNCVREASEAVIYEYKLQWPPHRLANAIEMLEIALQNYADFTSNNEKSDISVPTLPDLCEPCED